MRGMNLESPRIASSIQPEPESLHNSKPRSIIALEYIPVFMHITCTDLIFKEPMALQASAVDEILDYSCRRGHGVQGIRGCKMPKTIISLALKLVARDVAFYS
jgi:hypothetical protein